MAWPTPRQISPWTPRPAAKYYTRPPAPGMQPSRTASRWTSPTGKNTTYPYIIDCRRGPQLTYLSEGATIGLLEAIEYRARRGFCIDQPELRFLIRQAAHLTSTRPVTKSFPNRSFTERWVKKHDHVVSLRKARILEGSRAEASTEEAVRYYFRNLSAAIDELGLAELPAQIWNCDETGVCAQGRCATRVICPKGMSANVRRSNDRENVSIMGCISAAGACIPPMYIFGGVRRKVEWMADSPTGSVCAMSKSSNINGSLFRHWLKWFVDQLPSARPQLLILDGHFSHIDFAAVMWAIEQDVHIFVLPAHTSHFLQPLDVGIYQPFKRLYEKGIQSFPLYNNGSLPNKSDIAGITREPFELAFTAKNAKKAFERAGIFPLDLDVMLGSLVGDKPAMATMTTNSLPHHAVIVPHVERICVTQRQQHLLEARGLNLDALAVVNIAYKNMIVPKTKPTDPGSYVDERFSGAVLLSHPRMQNTLTAKEALRRYKLAAKESVEDEAEERACMNLEDKPAFHSGKTKKIYAAVAKAKKAAAKAQKAAEAERVKSEKLAKKATTAAEAERVKAAKAKKRPLVMPESNSTTTKATKRQHISSESDATTPKRAKTIVAEALI